MIDPPKPGRPPIADGVDILVRLPAPLYEKAKLIGGTVAQGIRAALVSKRVPNPLGNLK